MTRELSSSRRRPIPRTSLLTAGALVRLSRPRYLALTLPPFVVAVVASPDYSLAYLGLGAIAIILLRAISSVGNCVADRTEDAIDHPNRAALCERVGYPRLRCFVTGLAVLFLVLVAYMAIALHMYAPATGLWLAYFVMKLAYSFGPRLKPKRYSATILLGGLSAAMFVVGWIGMEMHDVPSGVAAGILLWGVGATLCGSKDVPNLEGDLAAGYRSVYLDLMDSSAPLRRAMAAVAVPYVLAAMLAVIGAVTGSEPGLRILWTFAMLPIGLVFAAVLVSARTVQERELVREAGYVYWIAFMFTVLVVVVPTWTTAAVAAAGLLWYIAASRRLHPDPAPISFPDVALLGRVAWRARGRAIVAPSAR